MAVSADDLKIEELRLRYLELIERPDVFPTLANWRFITSHKMRGLGHSLYRKYLQALTVDDTDREELHEIAIAEFPVYIKAIDREEAIDVVYSDLTTAPEATLEIIHEAGLFSAEYLINLLDDGDLSTVMAILDVYQPEYTDNDLEPMAELSQRLHSLPELGGVREVGGLFGSSMKYVCPQGHKNSAEAEYCTHPGCGLNKYGLTKQDNTRLATYTNRVKALKSLLEQA